MKIQCSCGTKYAFDVTPDMAANPVTLVCQNCGADNSAALNALIQQQFAAAPSEPAPAATAPSRVKVSIAHGPAHVTPAPGASAAAVMCGKHPGHFATQQCIVCHKPICPKCMELFGWVCSPFCKSEAESRGIAVPVYAQQASAREAAGWRHFRLVTWGIIAGIALMIGLWSWYLFSLSRPRTVFSVRFDEAADSGNARFITPNDSIVLRGGRLMRYNVKGKKELWRSELLDRAAIAQEAAKAHDEQQARFEKLKNDPKSELLPQELNKYAPAPAEHIAKDMEASAAAAQHLHVSGSNVWVRSPEKMVRYDHQSGKPAQEVPLGKGWDQRATASGDSLVLLRSTEKGETAIRVNLVSGQADTEQLSTAPASPLAASSGAKTNKTGAAMALARGTNRPPANTSQQSPALKAFKGRRDASLAEQIAAPVIIANKIQNERIEKAIADDDDSLTGGGGGYRGNTVMDGSGKFIQCSVKLIERKVIQRQAMKAPPKKSALDDATSVTSLREVANEMGNEWQRERTGGVAEEDASRYEVTLKKVGAASPDWVGEVVGSPSFFALQTVNLLIAGRTLQVFDLNGRKLWQAPLSFDAAYIGEYDEDFFGGGSGGPAVERGKLLFFRDAGVLSCFDLATGNARWRLPTVGVSRIMFDRDGMLYAQTTTASADTVKFSQQVDIGRKDHPLIIKVDSATGKLLWKSENNGSLAHITGNIIYTLEWMGGVETGDENPFGIPGAYIPPHVRIRRLSARDGHSIWEHYQRRAPLDVRFNERNIELLFRKEFQVLTFWSL